MNEVLHLLKIFKSNQKIDDTQIEGNESFSISKKAIQDNEITIEEKENMLKSEYKTIEKHYEKIEAIRKIKPVDMKDEDE